MTLKMLLKCCIAISLYAPLVLIDLLCYRFCEFADIMEEKIEKWVRE